MLDTIFIMLLVIAVIFMVFTVEWRSISFGILDVIIWFILSAAVFVIEIPYAAVLSDDTVISGSYNVGESMYYLSPLFFVIGFIMFLYLIIVLALPGLSGKMNKMM